MKAYEYLNAFGFEDASLLFTNDEFFEEEKPLVEDDTYQENVF